jgi:hypothetical protein
MRYLCVNEATHTRVSLSADVNLVCHVVRFTHSDGRSTRAFKPAEGWGIPDVVNWQQRE